MNLKKILLISAVLLNLGNFIINKPTEKIVYEYAVKKGINRKLSNELEKKLGPRLEENEQEFIDIISKDKSFLDSYVSSDILDNKHVSKEELKNTRKALNGNIINPKEIYAVIANGNGSSNPDSYSRRNTQYSLSNILSFYKFLKEKGVNDENITLLLYNETNIDLYNNAAHKLKLGFAILPVLGDEINIDGKSTKKNFINSIQKISADYNDILYIVYSNPGPDEYTNFHSYSPFLRFDGEEESMIKLNGTKVSAYELSGHIDKDFKKILILNDWNSSDIGRYFEGTNNMLIISSFNKDPKKNERFMMDFIVEQRKGKKIKSVENCDINYYNQNGFRRPLDECDIYDRKLIEDYQSQ